MTACDQLKNWNWDLGIPAVSLTVEDLALFSRLLLSHADGCKEAPVRRFLDLDDKLACLRLEAQLTPSQRIQIPISAVMRSAENIVSVPAYSEVFS